MEHSDNSRPVPLLKVGHPCSQSFHFLESVRIPPYTLAVKLRSEIFPIQPPLPMCGR